MQAFANYP